MRVTPRSEDELNPVLMPGEYDAEVIKSEEKVSQKGNEMIAIKLRVYHDGGTIIVDDWLLDGPSAPAAAKLKRFCESADLVAAYENGELCADSCMSRSVRVKLKIVRDETGQYGDKNGVAGYVFKQKFSPAPKPKPQGTGMSAAQAAAVNEQFPPDDIPFVWLLPFVLAAGSLFV
jgi:hypothetical protein